MMDYVENYISLKENDHNNVSIYITQSNEELKSLFQSIQLELESAQAKVNALQHNESELELLIRTKDNEIQEMQQKLDVFSSRKIFYSCFILLV